jgi:hypothetical protein
MQQPDMLLATATKDRRQATGHSRTGGNLGKNEANSIKPCMSKADAGYQ